MNIFTRSVEGVVKANWQGILGEKGNGVRVPSGKLSVCASKFLYPLAKAGHWETEKAGYENADSFEIYMVRVTRPALMLSDDLKKIIFPVVFSRIVSLHRETQAVVIFMFENYRSFLLCIGIFKKERWTYE